MKDNQNWLIKCLVITDQDEDIIKDQLPINDLHFSKCLYTDTPRTLDYSWLILDLDNCPSIRDSEMIKTNLAFLAKRIIVISKNFNRLKFYQDFCDIFFGWENFLELNFFQ